MPPPSTPLQLPRPVAWVALQLQLLLLGVALLGWNLLALLLHPLLPAATGRRVGRRAIARGYAGYWRVAQTLGLMQLDTAALDMLAGEPGLVIVANHPSMLDAPLLVARLPGCACIMKASLSRNPLIGPGARLARYIRNDSGFGMIKRAVADLRQGGQLLLFPEGTRTTGGRLGPFHASFALIAERAQAPIQTVFIDTDSPYLGKGWPLWKLPPLPMRYRVRLGRRYTPQADHDTLCREIQAYFEGVEGVEGAPAAARPATLPPIAA